MTALDVNTQAAPRMERRTTRSRCPHCGQTLPAIPDQHAAVCAPTPVKQYAIERTYGVKRMNGGFV